MQIDELTRALRDGAHDTHAPLDVSAVRRQGRRLRNRRRGVVGGAVLATAAVVGGVATSALPGVLPGGGGDDVTRVAATPPDTELTELEREVLRAVPAGYASGGTVVLPGPVKPESQVNQRVDDWLAGPPQPLGFHGFTGPGYIESTVDFPVDLVDKVLAANPDSHGVVADNGEVALGCVAWEGRGDCGPSLLVGDEATGWFYLYGIGTDDFLRPGAEMEVFLAPTYRRDGVGQSVVGGFDGVDATRVVLTLVDGSRQEADLDSGEVSAGDTLFWSEVDHEVARVDAYDVDGEVVDSHKIRPCSGGVDCEVR
jgi:hypothetical protein